MASDPTLFLPSADHFRTHVRSIAERLHREQLARTFRRLQELAASDVDDGPDWLDLTEDSTDEEVEAAYRNEFERDDETKAEPIRLQDARVLEGCPLDGWRLWDMFGERNNDFRFVPQDWVHVCRDARLLHPIGHLGAVALQWEVAGDDARHVPMTVSESADPEWKYDAASPSHCHAETAINGHLVHVDRVQVTKYGPGRSVLEFRVFVDRKLAGRGGRCGCSLGFGGGDLPAVARVGRSRVLTVDAVHGFDTPIVELWEVAPSEPRVTP